MTNPPKQAPYRNIWRLSWPQMLMMFLNFLIGFADVYVCGRIGREAQAAMGTIAQAMFFFLVLGVAVSNGSVAAISQSLGAGRRLRALRYGGLCFLTGLGLGAVILGLGFASRGLFLSLLRVPEAMRPEASYILNIFLWLMPVQYLYLITNAILRARQMVIAPLLAAAMVLLINTIGDFGFGLGMFGLPNFGFAGVAWATFFSVCGGFAINLWLMARQGLLLRRAFAPWRWARRAFAYVFKVAWPSGLMQIVWHSGYLVLIGITASLPLDSVSSLAGMAAGSRVEALLFMPCFAFNLTASILVGHYLGAGRPREAKRYGYRIMWLGVILISLGGICLWPFIPQAAGLLAADPVVQAEAVSYLRYNLLAMPFMAVSMILAGAIGGAGATLYNMLAFGLSIWLVRLPVAWWLGHELWRSSSGVWMSMLVSQMAQAGLLLYIFEYKDWPRFAMYKSEAPTNRSSHAK